MAVEPPTLENATAGRGLTVLKRVALTLAWSAMTALTLLAGLGGFGLVGPDEPRYAAIGAAMLQRHDYITPWLWGAAWFEKPVLYYWLAAASFAVGRVDAAWARLPNALFTLVLCLGLAAFLRRVHSARAAWIFLFVAPTSVFVFAFARSATTDMPLTAALGLGLALLYMWLQSEGRGWILGFAAALAVATLAKGPVAVVLAGLVLLLYCAIGRDWSPLLRIWQPGAIALYFAVAAPWFVWAQMRNPTFVKVFFLQHNLERFATNRFDHPQPVWFYLPVLLLAIFPWTGWLGLPLRDAVRRGTRWREAPLERFLWAWTLAPLIFFSLSHSKLPGYLLPAIPGALLLISVAAADAWECMPRWPLAISAVLAGAVPAILWLTPWLLAPRSLRPALSALPRTWLGLGAATAVILLILALRRRNVLVLGTTCLLITTAVATLTLGPARGDLNAALSGEPLASALQARCPSGLPTRCGGMPVYTWHLNRSRLYGAQFVLGARLTELPSTPSVPAVVITDRDALKMLSERLGPSIGVVAVPSEGALDPWLVTLISAR